MKKSTYRIKHLRFLNAILFFIILFVSCEEDDQIIRTDPSIHIVADPNYVSSDTIISVGQSFKVGVYAESNGNDKLTNFIAFLNGYRYLDIGLYSETYSKEITITKGLEDIDNWEFVIRDFEGNKSSTYLTITKDPTVNYGEIDEFVNVQLGAQFNSVIGSFFSFSNGTVYNMEGAYNMQENINMVYYYDDFDKLEENIITSPGGNIGDVAFPGEYAISNWTTVNTTRYSREKLSINIEDFETAVNDSILIANSFAYESGGRKTKFLKPGDLYSFVWDNKTGIFKVVSTSGTTDGNIIVDIKVQK
jgi:hypothetical protein